MVDGAVVGIGNAIIYGDTAWLAHIIVNKQYRNNGIGSAVTKALIDLVRKASCETILLIATALGEPVYKKLGFDIQTKYVFFNEGSFPPAIHSSAIKPFENSFHNELLRLDRIVSGEARSKLLQPHFSDCIVYLENGAIAGTYMPTLGEGLILAKNQGAGRALMELRATTSRRFCIPIENVDGLKILESFGCPEIRTASRMIYGKKISWDGSKIYNRIGGNLG